MRAACALAQGVGDLHGVSQGQVEPHPFARDQIVQRLAGDVFHHHEVDATLAADFVNGDDIGMVQRRSRLGLPHEPPPAAAP